MKETGTKKQESQVTQATEERPVREMTAEEMAQHEKLMDDLENAIGAYCEIRGLDNPLVVLGHVDSVDHERGSVTIRSSDREMPIVIFNSDFKLMIRPRGGIPLVLNGKICGSSREIWRLDYLNRYFYKESRSFFRQPTDTGLYASCVNALYFPPEQQEESCITPARLCRVMDVSLQGIQIRAKQLYFEIGDWLLLTDLILVPQQKRTHTFLCQVRRAAPAGRGEFLFGCQFDILSLQQQDILCSDIFVLHRLDIQACRLG